MIIRQVVDNITDTISNLRQGDLLFLPVDDILQLTNPENTSIGTLAKKALINQIKIVQESGIKVTGFSNFASDKKEEILKQLAMLGLQFPEIVYAPSPNAHSSAIDSTNFIVDIIKNDSPERIIMIDANVSQLDSLNAVLQGSGIPTILNHFKPEIKHTINSNFNNTINFPDDLNSFTDISPLGTSTYLIKNPKTNQQLVLKCEKDINASKENILRHSLYQLLGVPVPQSCFYNQISTQLVKALNFSSQNGLFQVLEYLPEGNSPANTTNTTIAHALLSNGNELLALIPDKELKAQASMILRQSKGIENQIWELAKKLNLPNAIRDNFLEKMADHLDVLATHYAIEERPIARRAKKANSENTAAGVLVYKIVNGEPHILLQERTNQQGYDNPGGSSKQEEFYLAETAIVETSEELNEQLSYQFHELMNAPSHDIIVYDDKGKPFTYRMYILESNEIDLHNIKDIEHLKKILVPLKDIFTSLDENKKVRVLDQETIEVSVQNDTHKITLFPPLYQMLKQSPIRDNLNRLLKNKKLLNRATQGSVNQTENVAVSPAYKPVESSMERQYKIDTAIINHIKMIREFKNKQIKNTHDVTNAVESDTSTLSQSELYLKIVLGDDYVPNDIEKNVHFFFDNYYQPEVTLTDEKRSLLIKQTIELIKEEKKTGSNYVYFYHACNDLISFMYLLYTTLYEVLRMSDDWPAFRTTNKFFNKFHTIHEFASYFTDYGNGVINCYDPGYQECAISANAFVFGNHTDHQRCSLSYYISNSVYQDQSLQNLLKELFSPFAIPEQFIMKLIDFFRNNIPPGGALYQLRVPAEEVKNYAYPAQGFGQLNEFQGERDLAVIFTHLKEAASNSSLTNHSSYIRKLEANMFLPPHMPFSVKEMHFSEQKIADQQANKASLQALIESIIPNLLQQSNQNSDLLNNSVPVIRLKNYIYEKHGIAKADETEKNSTAIDQGATFLLKAILDHDFKKITYLLTTYPQLKKHLFPDGKSTDLKTVLDLTFQHKDNWFADSFFTDTFGKDWWLDYLKMYPIKNDKELLDFYNVNKRFILEDQRALFFAHHKSFFEVIDPDKVDNIIKAFPANAFSQLHTFCHNKQIIHCIKRAILYNEDTFLDNLFKCQNINFNEILLKHFRSDKDGKPLLAFAILVETTEPCVEVMVNSNKIDLYAAYEGKTPLQITIEQGKNDMAEIIINAKSFDPNFNTHENFTPLHCAASHGSHSIVKLLLTFPAVNPNQICDGKTPFEIALINDHSEIARHLFESSTIDIYVTQNVTENLILVRKFLSSIKDEILSDSKELFSTIIAKIKTQDLLSIFTINECNTLFSNYKEIIFANLEKSLGFFKAIAKDINWKDEWHTIVEHKEVFHNLNVSSLQQWVALLPNAYHQNFVQLLPESKRMAILIPTVSLSDNPNIIFAQKREDNATPKPNIDNKKDPNF